MNNLIMASNFSRNERSCFILELDSYLCTVCLEVFKRPVRLPCEHLFCESCTACTRRNQDGDPACPICRRNYNTREEKFARDIADDIASCDANCKDCGKKFPLARMQAHLNNCKAGKELLKLSVQTSRLAMNGDTLSCDRDLGRSDGIARKDLFGARPRSLPQAGSSGLRGAEGRSVPNIPKTFDCPLCDSKRHLQESLMEHVNKIHGHEAQQVVCPICAAMPWGNADLKSQNFVDHINLRHKFEYDRFVDFSKKEEEMLHDTLKESMYEVRPKQR